MTGLAFTNKIANNKIANKVAIAAALMSSVSLLAVERANATCTPPTSTAAPANNASVICSDATTDQNTVGVNTFGYGTLTETGISITVQDGASVTVSEKRPADAGIGIHDGTINNFGTITTDTTNGIGIAALADVTVANSGIINTPGNGNHGILTTGTANVTNAVTGVIFGNTNAIDTGIATVANSGTIEAGASGEKTAISATITATVSNGDGSGNGVIRANVNNGRAIKVFSANSTINVTGNSGTIEAGIGMGVTGGVAIDASVAGGTASVTNNNFGVIRASSTAIVADGLVTLDNLAGGLIVSEGAYAVKSINGDVNVNQNVSGANTGVISAIALGAVAISATNGTATVANLGDGNTTGIIEGDSAAISAKNVIVTGNTGRIEARDTLSTAIYASHRRQRDQRRRHHHRRQVCHLCRGRQYHREGQ